jgi:type IX secretion system PorP/SprF family membrane protein
MKKMNCIVVTILSLIVTRSLNAQDPSFSQFFSSPLNINPALTANINADWRLISNLRDQWIGPASPYVTGTISYDSKIMQNKIPNVETENNIMGVGGMLMFDYAMSGVVKSTYASFNLSYNIKIIEDDYHKQRIGLGFGAIYGRRHIDFSRVDFEEQFTGLGFNTNLPTGETALSNMKPYVSASAGIIYSFTTEKSNLDLGVAGFHLNKPKQTFLEDEHQYLAIRKVAHANFETFINERVVLNTNAIYQFQMEANYFSVGAALGYYLGDAAESLLTGGLWYWSKNALIPYIGLAYKDFQFGASYDITTSKLNQAARKPSTWELSLILRGIKKPSKVIPCPWK